VSFRYEDLQTLAVSTMVDNHLIRSVDHDPSEYLRIMKVNMANQLAHAIIDNDIGEIEEHYDLERQGKIYIYHLKYLPNKIP